MFTPANAAPPKVKYIPKKELAMLPLTKEFKQAPQSPLMYGQKNNRRTKSTLKKGGKATTRKPVTTKITTTPPLTDFYWGKQINKTTKLTPRMISLQKGK